MFTANETTNSHLRERCLIRRERGDNICVHLHWDGSHDKHGEKKKKEQCGAVSGSCPWQGVGSEHKVWLSQMSRELVMTPHTDVHTEAHLILTHVLTSTCTHTYQDPGIKSVTLPIITSSLWTRSANRTDTCSQSCSLTHTSMQYVPCVAFSALHDVCFSLTLCALELHHNPSLLRPQQTHYSSMG